MKRAPVIALLVAGWLSLLVLFLSLGVVPECIGNSVVLVGLGVALLLGGGALARVSAATYRHNPLAERLGRASLTALGVVALLLGLVGLIRGC